MKQRNAVTLMLALGTVLGLAGCHNDPDEMPAPVDTVPAGTPLTVDIPANFPQMPIPEDNPFTEEGVELGRFLFYDERLSGNNTMSCASCHSPEAAFTDDGNQFSTGIDGIVGTRNSMALINLAWDTRYFWDGRVLTLEDQILRPVMDPIEMHETWPNAVAEIQAHAAYPPMFESAFGTSTVDSVLVAKAIAQFLRTMISGNSRFDKFQRGEGLLTVDEQLGLQLWQLEGGDPALGLGGQFGADCFHCHPTAGGRLTDGQLHNNGLDAEFTDLGAGGVTGLAEDMGRFKTPTLRNIALTAPYMHDGRFQTLEEVVEHYNSGGQQSPTVDPFMKFGQGGLELTPEKKQQLIAFLNTLTDMDFVNNPAFQDPGEP
ncbi:MAG TPA: cytochrome c peroxidase [Flavobacteriales bacterium]|nr:cytochrome c peroxidase [Flavobacteriales bacterium]